MIRKDQKESSIHGNIEVKNTYWFQVKQLRLYYI